MKNLRAVLVLFISIFTLCSLMSCGGTGTVSVGVGVGVGGPWVGPYGYPGGTVWIGGPVGPPVYYHLDPSQEEGREWVENQAQEISPEIVE
jgi:hypothetical protein